MTISDLLNESVKQALVATLIVGKKNSYTSSNPVESSAVLNYLRGGPRPTIIVATAMGKHLLALEDARRLPVNPALGSELYSAKKYSEDIYGR